MATVTVRTKTITIITELGDNEKSLQYYTENVITIIKASVNQIVTYEKEKCLQ
jgi:hypothetical protein